MLIRYVGGQVLVSGVTPVFAAVLPILAFFAMRLQAYTPRTTRIQHYCLSQCAILRSSENFGQTDFSSFWRFTLLDCAEQLLSENVARAQAADVDRAHADVRLVLLHARRAVDGARLRAGADVPAGERRAQRRGVDLAVRRTRELALPAIVAGHMCWVGLVRSSTLC